MKRTDITGLFPDATTEQINALMDINGADINSAKAGITDLQTQLATANATIEQLRADARDVEELTNRATAFETELNTLKASNAIRDMRESLQSNRRPRFTPHGRNRGGLHGTGTGYCGLRKAHSIPRDS